MYETDFRVNMHMHTLLDSVFLLCSSCVSESLRVCRFILMKVLKISQLKWAENQHVLLANKNGIKTKSILYPNLIFFLTDKRLFYYAAPLPITLVCFSTKIPSFARTFISEEQNNSLSYSWQNGHARITSTLSTCCIKKETSKGFKGQVLSIHDQTEI